RLAEGEAALEAVRRRLPGGSAAAVAAISALTGQGIPDLLAAIDRMLPVDPLVTETFHLKAADGASLALLHEFGRVLNTRYDGENCEVVAEVPESLRRRMETK